MTEGETKAEIMKRRTEAAAKMTDLAARISDQVLEFIAREHCLSWGDINEIPRIVARKLMSVLAKQPNPFKRVC